MDAEKRKRLEAAGWQFGTVQDLFGLTDEEMGEVETEIFFAVNPSTSTTPEEWIGVTDLPAETLKRILSFKAKGILKTTVLFESVSR